MLFPVSGVEIFPLIPFFVAFIISFFTSMGGVSGAFLLLPFQVSVLDFTSPAVTPTNLVYNIIAIPSGVYGYIKEQRMTWPIAWIVIAGTLPGVFLGTILRIKYLPDPGHFKFFVGCVLFYIGFRMLYEFTPREALKKRKSQMMEKAFQRRLGEIKKNNHPPKNAKAPVSTIRFSLNEYMFDFYGESFSFNPITLFALTLVVGIIGGTYGIGGGAIIAPFLIAIFGLPVYAIAGAALLGTLITSVVGIVFYVLIAPLYANTGLSIAPDWLLGAIFGAGGFAGTYCGARAQKYMPAKAIKLIIGLSILFLSIRYISVIF